MKFKILISILLAFSFLACSSENKFPVNSTAETEVAHGHSTDEEKDAGELTLNNGSKWETDESTRRHAVNLNVLVEAFDKKEDAYTETYIFLPPICRKSSEDWLKIAK